MSIYTDASVLNACPPQGHRGDIEGETQTGQLFKSFAVITSISFDSGRNSCQAQGEHTSSTLKGHIKPSSLNRNALGVRQNVKQQDRGIRLGKVVEVEQIGF